MDIERLDSLGEGAALVEDLTGRTLDPDRWVDHYLPLWTTPGRSRGTHRHRPDGLVVRAAVAQRLLWAPTSGQVEVTVCVGRGQAQTWSARGDDDAVVVACQGEVVFTSPQRLDYPPQLMVDLFEIGPATAAATYSKTALVPPGDRQLSVPSEDCLAGDRVMG